MFPDVGQPLLPPVCPRHLRIHYHTLSVQGVSGLSITYLSQQSNSSETSITVNPSTRPKVPEALYFQMSTIWQNSFPKSTCYPRT